MAPVPNLALIPGGARGEPARAAGAPGQDGGAEPDDVAAALIAGAGPPAPRDAAAARRHEARLRGLVDRHLDFVARVLRNAGTPPAEVDDEVQRTFIIASKRLDDVRLGAEKSFLVQIALHLAAHARRTLARRREVPEHEAPERADGLATPEQLTDRKRARVLLDRVLDQMDADLRAAFVLHEFEEMSMAEIAAALRIPQGTVASRLRRARAEFRMRAAALQDPGSVGPGARASNAGDPKAGDPKAGETKGGSET